MNLNKLDEIHHKLTEYLDQSRIFIKNIDLQTDVEPSSKTRQLEDGILDQVSGYLLEVSHISSFLQKCELHEVQPTPNQQNLFIGCQELCKKTKEISDQVIKWIMQTKKHLNEINCPMIIWTSIYQYHQIKILYLMMCLKHTNKYALF
ncbi:MAG: hypothetical protein HEEMFOPI_01738 [Holosporales bacterium]